MLRRLWALAAAALATDPPLYYYWHVPKTGGVSFSGDLVNQFGLVSCFGRQVKKAYDNTTWAMLHGKCDFGNTEGGYAARTRVFPRPPLPLLLAREPLAHVVSQFSHCQLASDLKKWGHKRASLEDWVEAWRAAAYGDSARARAKAFETAKSICHFNPINMQARKLCDRYDHESAFGGAKRPIDDDACLRDALGAVAAAWHVGVLEAYDAGLCVLGLRKSGIGSQPSTHVRPTPLSRCVFTTTTSSLSVPPRRSVARDAAVTSPAKRQATRRRDDVPRPWARWARRQTAMNWNVDAERTSPYCTKVA